MFKALACSGADWGLVELLVEDDEKDPDTSRATAEGCDVVDDIEAFVALIRSAAATAKTFLLILLTFEFAAPFFPGIIAALLVAGWVLLLLLLLLLLLTRNNSLEGGCFRCGWSSSCIWALCCCVVADRFL